MIPETHLFDTDVVIDMLRENRYRRGAIALITLIEVLRGVAAEKQPRVKHLLEESFDVIGLGNEVLLTYCHLYGELRREGQSLPDADLLVASAAMAHGFCLESRDEHFKRLEEHGLMLETPKEKPVQGCAGPGQ